MLSLLSLPLQPPQTFVMNSLRWSGTILQAHVGVQSTINSTWIRTQLWQHSIMQLEFYFQIRNLLYRQRNAWRITKNLCAAIFTVSANRVLCSLTKLPITTLYFRTILCLSRDLARTYARMSSILVTVSLNRIVPSCSITPLGTIISLRNYRLDTIHRIILDCAM